jgi:hypothetical protein
MNQGTRWVLLMKYKQSFKKISCKWTFKTEQQKFLDCTENFSRASLKCLQIFYFIPIWLQWNWQLKVYYWISLIILSKIQAQPYISMTQYWAEKIDIRYMGYNVQYHTHLGGKIREKVFTLRTEYKCRRYFLTESVSDCAYQTWSADSPLPSPPPLLHHLPL